MRNKAATIRKLRTMITRTRFLLLVPLFFLTPCREGMTAEWQQTSAKWENEIAAFEANDKTNPPPKGAVLFLGSSGIRLWRTLPDDFPKHQVINRGFGGSEILDSTYFSERIVFPYEPRMIVFRAGGNDLWNGKPTEQVFADYQDFVAGVHARLPETEIVWIAWNHTPSRWKQADKETELNRWVKEFAATSPRLKYVETYDFIMGPDGRPRPELFVEDELHFSTEGYKLLADRVRPVLPKVD